MTSKIYISIIAILLVTLTYISFNSWNYYRLTEPSINAVYSNEKKVMTTEGEKLACSVQVIDKPTGRMIASHRFILAKNNVCPNSPQKFYISKNEYIKEIQSSETYGIFDNDYLDPTIAKPEQWISTLSSTNSSKSN